MVQMKKTEQNSRKRTKWNGDKQHTRGRVQNTGYQDAQWNHWVLHEHKKTQAEMSYIKWNKEKSTGTNSGEDEAENQINELNHFKEGKGIQSEQQEERQIQKNEEPLGHL